MDARIEVLPIGDIVSRVRSAVPEPMTITVTASPSRGMEPTIEVAGEIARLGHHAIPHVSARLVRDEAHLETLLEQARADGITEIFLVGGDAEEPAGEYTSGAELLRVLNERDHGLRIGIPGYPEGHPLITDEELDAALQEKAAHADLIITQMCFDAGAVHSWISRMRAGGVDLPIHAGVPGPINPLKLLRISAKVGVGESLRVLKSHRGGARLVSPKPWDPDPLVDQLIAEPSAIAGLHLYSFNDVAAAYRWLAGRGL